MAARSHEVLIERGRTLRSMGESIARLDLNALDPYRRLPRLVWPFLDHARVAMLAGPRPVQVHRNETRDAKRAGSNRFGI